MALGFRDSQALEVVLTSGLCPADVLAGSARVVHGADGSLVLAPTHPLPKAAIHRLREVGVEVEAALPGGAREVGCWAEAVALARVAVPAIPALVLLVTETSSALIDPTGEDPRPAGKAVGVPTPRDIASLVDPTGEDPRPAGKAVGVPTPRDFASLVDPTGEDPRPAGKAVGVPTPRDFASLIDLAAELVRLGCDRQELLLAGGVGAIRVVDPPTYTVIRGLDREGGLRVFAPDPAGQDSVWTELGYRHPLADRLRARPGTLHLISGDRWRTLPDAGWFGLDAAVALTVPGDHAALPAIPLLARRRIELRLSGGRREPPSLWVLRHGGVAAIDQLLAYLPEDVVARLTFAATGGDDPLVVVRARSGRHAPPELALAAEPYAPLAELPDIYAPAGSIVEPPLRRERLRQILTGPEAAGAEGGDVLWLAPLPERRFRVERIADRAFAPLAEWADYVIHASAPALVPWIHATELDFAPFVSTGLEWASGPPSPDASGEGDADDKRTRPRAVRSVTPVAVPDAPEPVAVPRKAAAEVATGTVSQPEPQAAELPVDVELAALEAAFIELDAPGDAPERIALLDRLAAAYARLGRRREAGQCFARAVWEAPPAQAEARIDAWIAADGGLAGNHALARILAQGSPHPDDVRVVAAAVARTAADGRGARPAIASEPHRVQRWLDEHDGGLDARTLWLARLGLARLSGGDPLGLAHTRDRILAALAGGLPVERELPPFLRFAGRTGALGNASGEHLTAALDDLAQRILRTRRKRSPTEAPAQLTGAYVSLQLAYGFARIGKHERAHALVGEARAALADVASDPVHAYLVTAFVARIEQAIAGMAPETPLPAALGTALAALDRLARYKVDRLREASRILEPLAGLDPFGVFIDRRTESRGPEFVAVRGIADPRARARAVDALVQLAAASDADRERLIDGILDVLLGLPEAQAVPILAATSPLVARLPEPRRAILYAAALVVAGHFGRTDLVPPLLALLGAAIRAVAATDLERVLQHSLRALRRIGLRLEIAELLAEAEHARSANEPGALYGRLAIAAGLAYLGDAARALPIFDQARAALTADFQVVGEVRKDGSRPSLTRPLELTRALALAYAQAPLGAALAGIAELVAHLRDITDNLNTNSHFCLSVLHFVESLVLGITSDDLVLGDAGRRFIEDDEHLIRRRLHRDLGGSS